MNDLIDRSALMEYPFQRGKSSCDEANANMYFLSGVASVLEYAKNLPSIPAEVVRYGRWKHIVSWYPESDYDQCTNCGFTVSRGYGYNKPEWKFCTNCGARMDSDRESAHQKTQAGQGFCGSNKPISAHEMDRQGEGDSDG